MLEMQNKLILGDNESTANPLDNNYHKKFESWGVRRNDPKISK